MICPTHSFKAVERWGNSIKVSIFCKSANEHWLAIAIVALSAEWLTYAQPSMVGRWSHGWSPAVVRYGLSGPSIVVHY